MHEKNPTQYWKEAYSEGKPSEDVWRQEMCFILAKTLIF